MTRSERVKQCVKIAQHSVHRWTPNGKKPILGFNPEPGRPYIVLRNVVYSNPLVTLPIEQGYTCDLASIPRLLWWVPGLSPTDANKRAAVVHDLIYERQMVDRVIADALFVSILKADGVNFFVRWAMYSAVRIFGERAWQHNQRVNERRARVMREAKKWNP